LTKKALRELHNLSLSEIPTGYAADNLKKTAGDTFMPRQYKPLSRNFKAFVSINLKSSPRLPHAFKHTFHL
jgi:hypothetical protein